jgi:guanosine-3',5'-bis(diphosphate) 3'-pyrophosphohydrolase
MRIARETLEIYAPIAQRLGMALVKSELQNLGFRALYPWRHAIIEKHIRSQPVLRREAMAQVEVQLSQRLAKEGLEHRLVSRIKTPWSIYNKMREESKSFDQVMDVFGFRLVVRSVPTATTRWARCMPRSSRWMGVSATSSPSQGQRLPVAAHRAVRALRLADRSADPHRGNGPDRRARRGRALDLQVRWRCAQQRAEPRPRVDRRADRLQRAADSSLEFLDNVKVDLFPDEVYLFTPKGKILALPRNSTALDFAYAVHTDVGNKAVASRVDKKLVPLRTKLQRADGGDHHRHVGCAETAVAGIRGHQQGAHRHPPPAQAPGARGRGAAWAPHARPRAGSDGFRSSACRRGGWMRSFPSIAIRAWKPAGRSRARQLDADPGRAGADGPRRCARPAFAPFAGKDPDQRHRARGDQLRQLLPADSRRRDHGLPHRRQGHRGAPHGLPEPGRVPQVARALGADRLGQQRYRRLRHRVDRRCGKRPGVLAQLAAAVAQSQSNIERVDYLDRDVNAAVLRFNIQVRDRNHLAEVMRRLRRLNVVVSVRRQ